MIKFSLSARLALITAIALPLALPVKSETIPPKASIQLAQSSTTPLPEDVELEELRQQLRIPAKVNLDAQKYSPSLSTGIPSAFGANWGDSFVSLSGATAGNNRDGQIDGSISLGLGLGDSSQLAGVTLAYNIGSINNFGQNGTFDLQVSRVAYQEPEHQIAVAAGWSGFAQYGSEDIIPSTVWGAITSVSLLQPDDAVNKMPLLLSVGAGGGYFSGYNGPT
ncbi:MAG: hypothetical protein ACRC6M_07160, partial [Microcystaceae cyanobacterium]